MEEVGGAGIREVEVSQQPTLEQTLRSFRKSVDAAGVEITESGGGGFFGELDDQGAENSPFLLMWQAEDMICEQILSEKLSGEELEKAKQQYLDTKTLFIDKSSGGDGETKASIERAFGLGVTSNEVALYGIGHGLEVPSDILADHYITWAKNQHESVGDYPGYASTWHERSTVITGAHARGELKDEDFNRVRETVNQYAPEGMKIADDGEVQATLRARLEMTARQEKWELEFRIRRELAAAHDDPNRKNRILAFLARIHEQSQNSESSDGEGENT